MSALKDFCERALVFVIDHGFWFTLGALGLAFLLGAVLF